MEIEPTEIVELLVFWSSFLLNNEVVSFPTDEVGEAFARYGGGQSGVLW